MNWNLVSSSMFRLFRPVLAPVLAMFCLAIVARGADAQMSVEGDVVEITGGSGRDAWRLRYGTLTSYQRHFIPWSADRAWFSHGGWLRLIDTKKGLVTGRWNFPGEIVSLQPQASGVQVEVEEKLSSDKPFRRTFPFDPVSPWVPYWPSGQLIVSRVSRTEVTILARPLDLEAPSGPAKISAEQIRELLAGFEEMSKRDPFAPWFQAGAGMLRKDMGDAEAATLLRQAIQVPSA